MAISTSSFLLRAASLCGAAGLLVVWSGLHAAGPEGELGLVSTSPAGERPRDGDGRLLRMMIAARQGSAGIPLPRAPLPSAPIAAPTVVALMPVPPRAVATIRPSGAIAGPASPIDALVEDPRPEEVPPMAWSIQPAAGPARPVSARRQPARIEAGSSGAAVVEPVPEMPPRGSRYRDPVLPPLVGQPQWREWVLAVNLNGREVSQGSLFAEDPATGRLSIAVAQLSLWRIRVDPAKAITLQGEPFYPLDAINGAKALPDYDQLTVRLDLPADAFEVYTVDVDPERGPEPRAGQGAFLDYDLLLTAGQGVNEQLSGLAEAGAFGSWGVLTSSLRAQDIAGEAEVSRLETTFSRDLPDRRATLRIGDSLTVGGSFSSSVRFGGLQYATNFATDPTFVTFPTPAIGGLATQDSVVDVFIDNLRRDQRSVPAGPFSLDNLPIVTGAGQVELRVKDLLGRERVVVQPYYVSPRLLKEGLHDFAYEVGLERRHYGDRSFDYGDLLASTTQRYGLSPGLTGEAHAEASAKAQSLVVGGAALLGGNLGVVSGGIGIGQHDEELGALGQLAYEYSNDQFGFGARSRLTTDGFRQLGSDDGKTARVDQLNFSVSLGAAGTLGVLFANEDRRGEEDRRILSGSWSLPLGPGTFLLSAGQTLSPDHDLAITATYALPLGGNRSIVGQAGRQNGKVNTSAVFRQTRGASDLGLDYRIGAQGGDDPKFVEGRFDYQTAYGSGVAELEHVDGQSRARLGVDGSVTMVDGRIAASRRLGNAFGLVEVPGFENVRVYLDNREIGRTDAQGRLLLPDLRAYEANRIRIELDDVPIDAVVGNGEAVAVPYQRSGVVIPFAAERTRQATAILRDAAGQPLPPATELVSADGTIRALVGRDGFTQVTGVLGQGQSVSGSAGRRSVTCALPGASAEELLPDLGEVRCR